MPFGDGTGPWWAQGRWNCRRGFGRGMGIGFGRRFQGAAIANNVSREEEASELKAYAEMLKAELEEVKKRIANLK